MADDDQRIKARSSARPSRPESRRIEEDSECLSDDSDDKPGARHIPAPQGRLCGLRNTSVYDSFATLESSESKPSPTVVTATLVEDNDDMEARLHQRLKEKEAELKSRFAEKEAELKAKEARLPLNVSRLPTEYRDSVTVTASICPSSASCDTLSSWPDLCVAMFSKEEIRTGKNLGTGTFSSVFDIKSIKLDSQVHWWGQNEHSHRRLLISDSCRKQKIVIKALNSSIDPKKKELAGKRLKYEARLVSKFSHENVVSILGMSSPDAPIADFFFLMNQIQETLFQCITKSWNKRQRGKPKFMLNQVKTATDVAAGLDYIHSRNIIFSDLKAENIGFNNAGVLKLCNFSKAQSLARKRNTTNKPYDMALCTKAVYHGTRPYAAPEIALKVPCNLSVDTYSFAIVLWEIMSLKLCFGRDMKSNNTFGALLDNAYDSKAQKGTNRPKMEEDTPKALRDLITRCWELDPINRPCMKDVLLSLNFFQDTLKMVM